MLNSLLYPRHSVSTSVGLLAVRVVMGVAFIMHGLPKIYRDGSFYLEDKLIMMGWMGGDSVPAPLQAAAALSEVVGGTLLVLGLFTPIAALFLAVTMAVAVAMHLSKGDPFVAPGKASYELAAVFLANSALLLLAGGGRLSLDALLFGSTPAEEPPYAKDEPDSFSPRRQPRPH